MQASMESMTTSQVGVPVPSVSYEKATHIEATVIVFPPETAGGQPIFDVDPITIPGSGSSGGPAYSVLILKLVKGTDDLATLEFKNPGLTVPVLPVGFKVLNEVILDATAKKRLVLIENSVTELTTFTYNILINFSLTSRPEKMFQALHDPTIVVATEPIDG
jgi:hypothetical protein